MRAAVPYKCNYTFNLRATWKEEEYVNRFLSLLAIRVSLVYFIFLFFSLFLKGWQIKYNVPGFTFKACGV